MSLFGSGGLAGRAITGLSPQNTLPYGNVVNGINSVVNTVNGGSNSFAGINNSQDYLGKNWFYSPDGQSWNPVANATPEQLSNLPKNYWVKDQYGNVRQMTNQNPGGLTGFWNNYGGLINTGVGLALGGLNIYNGFKQNAMMEDYLGFQKDLANRNLANQAKLVNNAIASAAKIAASQEGSIGADGSVGLTAENVRKAYDEEAKKRFVDGSALT